MVRFISLVREKTKREVEDGLLIEISVCNCERLQLYVFTLLLVYWHSCMSLACAHGRILAIFPKWMFLCLGYKQVCIIWLTNLCPVSLSVYLCISLHQTIILSLCVIKNSFGLIADLENKASGLSSLSRSYHKDAQYLNMRSTFAKIAAGGVLTLVILLYFFVF